MKQKIEKMVELFVGYFVLFAISATLAFIISVKPLVWPSFWVFVWGTIIVMVTSTVATYWHLHYEKKKEK